MLVKRPYHLEPGDHAIGAVELSARGLGVEMAAGHDRRAGVIGAGAARKDIAGGIEVGCAARLLAPGDEQIAGLAGKIGERKPAHPARRRPADPGHLHEARPQPVGVDPHILHGIPPGAVLLDRNTTGNYLDSAK